MFSHNQDVQSKPTSFLFLFLFRYDRDCSSKLSVDEIVLALQDLSVGGGKVTQADINHYLERHDDDGDGLVDFDEFCSVFDRLYTPRPVT